jgi:hypothetical protein
MNTNNGYENAPRRYVTRTNGEVTKTFVQPFQSRFESETMPDTLYGALRVFL